jgi:hypothetical protein
MPAPVPIRVRYGDTGALGAAAVALGQAQGDQRRRDEMAAQRAQDMAFLMAELGRRNAARDRSRAQMQQFMYGTPAPVQRAAGAQLVTSRTAALPTLPGLTEEETRLYQAGQSQGITQLTNDLAARALSRIGGGTGAPIDTSQGAKQAFVERYAVAADLPPEEVEVLNAIASDPKSTVSQVRVAASEAATRTRQARTEGQLSPRRRTELQIDETEAQRKQLLMRMKDVRKQLESMGYSPDQGGEQFMVEPVNQGWWRRTIPGRVISGPKEQPQVDPEALRLYEEFHRMRAEAARLTQERAGLVGGTQTVPMLRSPDAQPVGPYVEQGGLDDDPLGIL